MFAKRSLRWVAGAGPATDRFSRTCLPDGFFRKFSAERGGAPKGPGRATRDGAARPALPGLQPRGQAHYTAQKGVPGLAGSPPVWKNVP